MLLTSRVINMVYRERVGWCYSQRKMHFLSHPSELLNEFTQIRLMTSTSGNKISVFLNATHTVEAQRVFQWLQDTFRSDETVKQNLNMLICSKSTKIIRMCTPIFTLLLYLQNYNYGVTIRAE